MASTSTADAAMVTQIPSVASYAEATSSTLFGYAAAATADVTYQEGSAATYAYATNDGHCKTSVGPIFFSVIENY